MNSIYALPPTPLSQHGSDELDPLELKRLFRTVDRRTQLAIADTLLERPDAHSEVAWASVPKSETVSKIAALSEEHKLVLADWIITKYAVNIGACESLDDFRDSEAIRDATSPRITIEELDFLPSEKDIADVLAHAELAEDPWESLSKCQQAFLLGYLRYGGMLAASNGVCHPVSPLEWCRTDPEFATAFEDVKNLLQDRLRHEAHTRALHGERQPSFYQGRPVLSDQDRAQIYITRPNNQLLRFLMTHM